MKRTIILILLFVAFVLKLEAQQTKIDIEKEPIFQQAKAYYNQQKYAISYYYFDLYLKEVTSNSSVLVEEAKYYKAVNAYKLRKPIAEKELKSYLLKYPYTPHLDAIYYMLGMLQYEQGEYEAALLYFEKVLIRNLVGEQKDKCLLYMGYSLLYTHKIEDALDVFNFIKKQKTPYSIVAQYYAGYSQYLLERYEQALKNLLPIENYPQFNRTAPYYVTQIYFFLKRFEQANRRARALFKKFPNNKNNIALYKMLAQQAYSDKNYQKAIDYFIKYENSNVILQRDELYSMGISYLKLEQPKKAINCFSKVTTENDEITENAYLQLGNAFIKINDKNNARMSFQSALQTHFNPQVREEAMFNYALATYESELGFGESIKSFEAFIKEFPNSKNVNKAHESLINGYLTSNNFYEAYKSILRVRRLTPRLRRVKQYLEYNLGTDAFINKKFSVAINYFTLAKHTLPNGEYIPDILYWRSESYFNTQQYSKASLDLVHFFNSPKVIKSPNYIDAFYALGYAYFVQKKYKKALSWFLTYLQKEKAKGKKQYVDAQNRVGDIYFYQRNFAKANKHYQYSATKNRYGDYALYQSAYIEGLQKKYNNKIRKLQRLLAQYPQSQYADNALYEIGRSYIMLDNDKKAITSFQKLTQKYPHSPYYATAKLEQGLIFFEKRKYQQASPIFKQIIAEYPSSEEAQTAFETLETIAINTDKVASHLKYAQKIGRIDDANKTQHADSILFLTAEKRYLQADYPNAIIRLKKYLQQSYPNGKFRDVAQFYLAESYYKQHQKQQALNAYAEIVDNPKSAFLERAILRASEISFEKKNYRLSLRYFQELYKVAQTRENKDIAQQGALRSSSLLHNDKETLMIVKKILTDTEAGEEVRYEALLNRANILLKRNQPSQALKDLRKISINTRTSIGAEAKYLTAKTYYSLQMLDKAEKEIMDYAQIGTSHSYWLAKSFILLADIYMKEGDDFQAKQYLLSLQKNYTTNDEIQHQIKKRLSQIEKEEKAKVSQ